MTGALFRLPAPGDNCAIATRRLDAGTVLEHAGRRFALDAPVLEGHRFAVRALAPGDDLLSWGLPFGRAIRSIPAGGYVCNQAMLEALRGRTLPFTPPATPNFEDHASEYVLTETALAPGTQVALYPETRTFLGYPRPGGRGAGTRNHVVVLGLTSRVAGYVRALEARLQPRRAAGLDGIVAVSHTEGAGGEPLNNRALVLRALAGFVAHPNAAAVLIADDGAGQITSADLRAYLVAEGYPLDHVPHHWLALTGDFEADLAEGARVVEGWLPEVPAPRQPVSLAQLNVALQCGGSDAFSGISANPLAAAVAREIIRFGGAACLAETTELIGAETYVLQNVRDAHTARAFLAYIERYKELLAWHGVTGESNVSGGNRYRGLYNIILKSVGAAAKRDPLVRLDYAVDYAERMTRPGYYFMNTPGNDLESLAGQVAGGANLIIFTTGNGSITNFPFVPTLKVMTTTTRYQLLEREMDFNAGAYLDGAAFENLTRALLELTVEIASGRLSKGEQAGHSQVSLWRNWRQTGPRQSAADMPEPSGQPLPTRTHDLLPAPPPFTLLRAGRRLAADRVGLILPTSLCAGQVARLAAARLNAHGLAQAHGLSRFVALVHTEGCGAAGHSTGALYHRTLLNYMTHPLVACGLFLEHGCEKTHNDYFHRQLVQAGGDPAHYGWASVQLDGGLDKVLDKIESWFRAVLSGQPAPSEEVVGVGALRLGLHTAGEVPAPLAVALAQVVRTVSAAGGLVVLPATSTLLGSRAFANEALLAPPAPTLAYGQAPIVRGLHVMETPSTHWVEALTGLGATGVEVILAVPGARPAQAHPLVPVLQLAPGPTTLTGFDIVPDSAPADWAAQTLAHVTAAAGRRAQPRRLAQGDVDFQLTRGLLGVTV